KTPFPGWRESDLFVGSVRRSGVGDSHPPSLDRAIRPQGNIHVVGQQAAGRQHVWSVGEGAGLGEDGRQRATKGRRHAQERGYWRARTHPLPPPPPPPPPHP